jgi:SAM-dependent methyltransferase
VLSAQGWLDMSIIDDDVIYSVNDKSKIAFDHFYLYHDVSEFLKFSNDFHPRKFEIEPFLKLSKIYDKYEKSYDINLSDDETTLAIQKQILTHIEGNIVGPSVVRLGMSGMFHKYFMETSFRPEEFHRDPISFKRMLDFFSFLGWFKKKNETFQFTEKGLFFARRASAYGVTVSYIPTFVKMDELLFGDGNILKINQTDGPEIHVDREMNVWGSGGAHSTYFKVIDEIVIEIFNKPIDEQPRGILDMGCGNGAFLQHIFEVIAGQTLRGTVLEEYPLFLVGADFNEAAIKVTRSNLINADIWAKVIFGDIGDPQRLADDLKEDYNIELKDLLSVRSFLDHNRMWSNPTSDKIITSESTGAFASRGKRLLNSDVEKNLFEHFKKWAPYVSRYGLLVIELHTIDPALTSENLGKTAATAYDATHGFSDQYILEIDSFLTAAGEAGLNPVPRHFTKFPDSDLATVSINLLKG